MRSGGFAHSASWSDIWVLTRASTSQAARQPRADTSQSKAPHRRAGRWSRRPGAPFANPARSTRSISRVRARRGHGIAIIASARKLACLFWFLLTREQDYAHQQPSLTAKKLRLLEIRAGARTLKGTPTGVWATREAMREGERRLAEQAGRRLGRGCWR